MSTADAVDPRVLAMLSRRERMVSWILARPDLDALGAKGRIIFDIGRGASGQAAVSVAFHRTPEELK